MAVLDPLKLVLTNLDDGHEETLTFANHPKDEARGERAILFSRELWIEREDFAEVAAAEGLQAPHRGRRSAPVAPASSAATRWSGRRRPRGRTALPWTRNPAPGMEGANRKVKGTIHWVSAPAAWRKCACTTACSPSRIRIPTSSGKTYRRLFNPRFAQGGDRLRRTGGRRRRAEQASSSNASATSWPTATTTRRDAGVQPQRDPARHLGGRRHGVLYAQLHLTLPIWVMDLDVARRDLSATMPKVALGHRLVEHNVDRRSGGPFGAAVFRPARPASSRSGSTAWCRQSLRWRTPK